MLTVRDLPRSGLRARLRHAEESGAALTHAVFLHGLGSGAGSWPLRAPMPPAICAVFLDLPGHGLRSAELPRRIEDVAATVALAIDELQLERVILVGHSFGGLVSLHVEPSLGARLLSTILFCTGARFRRVESVLRSLERGPRRAGLSADHVRSVVPDVPGPMLSQALARTERVGRETMIRGLAILEHYDGTVHLPVLEPRPRTLVYGEADPMVSIEEAERLARRIDAAPIALAGVGHFPMLERPQEFRQLLGELLGRTLSTSRCAARDGAELDGEGRESRA